MPDLHIVKTWFARYGLAVWFGVIFVMRLSVLLTGNVGFDARLYLAATRAWLSGAEPWVVIQQQQFAAPPPSLLPLVPFALLPETLGIAVLMLLAVLGVVATVRMLRLDWWWVLFPPFLESAFNGNPQAVLVPLILAGAGPIAAFLKVYAVVPIALTLRWRSLIITVLALLLTAPLLPWASYLAHASELTASLARQADGGMSATVVPILIPIAALLLLLVGRERAAWLAVPVLWPSTQWYYATLAVPGLQGVPLAAAILAIPVQGAPVFAVAVIAWQTRNFSLQRLRRAWTGPPMRGVSQLPAGVRTDPSSSS